MKKKTKSRIFLETKCPGLLEALETIQEERRVRREVARIVGINMLKDVDFTRLSDKELVELGKKLLGEL